MKNKSLKTEILTLLIVTGVIPILIMSFFANRLYSGIVEKRLIPLVEKNVESLSLNLSLRFLNYQALVNECAQDPVIGKISAEEYELVHRKRLASEQIAGILQNTNYQSRIEYPFRYAIYCKDGTVFADYTYSQKDILSETREKIENLPYFHSFMETGLVCQTAGMEDSLFHTGSEQRFTFSRNIITNGISSGIILFTIDPFYFNNLVSKTEFADGTGVYIFDGYGNTVFEWNTEGKRCALNAGEAAQYLNYPDGKSFETGHLLVNTNTLGFSTDRYNWRLVCVTPLDQILLQQNLFVFIIWSISLAVILFAFFSAKRIQKAYLNPVEYYSRYVSNLDFDNLDLPPEIFGSGEVLTLGEGLSSMVVRLKDDLKEIEEKEEERRKQEMAALNMQINPHFIKNTLNSIRLSAEMSEAPMVSEQIQTFTKLIDHIFHSADISTVSDEILYLEEYIKLQNLRYQNKFVFQSDIEDALIDLAIPPLIFQPLIENSIVHGFAGKKGRGIIKLRGTADGDRAVFYIEDNGTGIPDPENVLKNGSHGMTNVDRRIKLLYGDLYGLTASRCENGGTRITIVIPFKEDLHA